jgi:tetratricopeptide (TPR) repeat protein
MITRENVRRLALLMAVLIGPVLAGTALAQTGLVRGKVVDAKNEPVDGAKVTIQYLDGATRVLTTKTNKKGEFTQIGLASGKYNVTVEKEGIGSQSQETGVRIGQTADLRFVLTPATAGPTKEELEKREKLQSTFGAGVEASKVGNYDEAIAQFTAALTTVPECFDCQYNIGYAYLQKKDFEKAEAAYKAAIALKSDYGPAYSALANLYNSQKRFDEAAEMSALAAKHSGEAGGASADNLYNQGVILWNGGQTAEAMAKFEEAVKIDPNHADSHYWLGMANLNQGKMAEARAMFEKYLELAPDGANAAQAKAIMSQLPQ